MIWSSGEVSFFMVLDMVALPRREGSFSVLFEKVYEFYQKIICVQTNLNMHFFVGTSQPSFLGKMKKCRLFTQKATTGEGVV